MTYSDNTKEVKGKEANQSDILPKKRNKDSNKLKDQT